MQVCWLSLCATPCSAKPQAEREKQARVTVRSAEAAIAGKVVEGAMAYAYHPTALRVRAMARGR
jgi:hypothetical protein